MSTLVHRSAACLGLCITLGWGCHGSRDASPAAATSSRTESAARPGESRFRIVHVDARLGVESVSQAVARTRRLAARHGGYVESGSARRDDGGSASLVLRIPAGRLEACRAELRRLGEVERESERVEDVTEQHADLDARLRNARTQEARLRELLTARTGSLSDVLAVEAELGRVRETIERHEAEQRVLDARVAYAEVAVSLEPRSIAFWQEPGASLASAAELGTSTAAAAVVGVAMAVLALGPTALVGLVAMLALVLLARLATRRRSVVRSA